jgi:hypothetical protein
MSKSKSIEILSSDSSSLKNLLTEKHDLQKQAIELDREIRHIQTAK